MPLEAKGERRVYMRVRVTAAEGELVAEILWDWAMPEDEAPPTTQAVQACRERLGEA